MNSYLLLLLGIFLFFLEFFLPGAVMGVLGLLCIAASVIFFAMETSSSLYLLLYALVIIALLVGAFKLAVWRIRSSGKEGTFYSTNDQAGYRADSYNTNLIGKQGTALTDLRPAGWITIDGDTLQALSQSGFIARGTPIVVVSGEGAELTVKPIQEEIPL